MFPSLFKINLEFSMSQALSVFLILLSVLYMQKMGSYAAESSNSYEIESSDIEDRPLKKAKKSELDNFESENHLECSSVHILNNTRHEKQEKEQQQTEVELLNNNEIQLDGKQPKVDQTYNYLPQGTFIYVYHLFLLLCCLLSPKRFFFQITK